MASTTPATARPAAALPGQIPRPDSSVDRSQMIKIAITVARVAASIIIPILSFVFLPLPFALAITGVVIIANLVDCLSRFVPSNEGERAPALPSERTTVVHHHVASAPAVVRPLDPRTSSEQRHYWTDAYVRGIDRERDARFAAYAASAGLRSPAATSMHRRADTLFEGDGPHLRVGSGHMGGRPAFGVATSYSGYGSAPASRPPLAAHVAVGSGLLGSSSPAPFYRTPASALAVSSSPRGAADGFRSHVAVGARAASE